MCVAGPESWDCPPPTLPSGSGCRVAMISKIENAQVSPSLATISRLADALEVPVTSLFQGLDEERDALHAERVADPNWADPAPAAATAISSWIDAGTGQAHGADAGHAHQSE